MNSQIYVTLEIPQAQTKFDSNLESTFNKFLTKKWSSFINASFPGTPDILEVGINDLIQYIGAQLSGVPDFIMRQVAIYKLIYKSPSHSALEWMLNPELAKAVDSETDLSTSLAKYFFDAIDKKKSLAAYFKTMWYSLLPCFDVRGMTSVNGSESAMLTYCMWKNLPVSCAAIFSTFPTDSGMCCVFNMVKAENLFLESEYTRLINEMQSKDKKLALQNTTMPLWSKKSLMGIEGKGLGLITILDSHSDLVGPMTVYDNTLGFTALVDSRDSFPFIKTKGIPIQPGHFNQIVLSAVEIDAADEIRHLAPRSRNCLFSDETSHLRFHKIYTQTNCVLECRIVAAQKEVKERFNMSTVCTPWYLPFNEGTFCDPWQGKVFQETMSDGTESPGCLKQCLPDCKRTVYDPKVMTQKITGCDEHNLGLTGLCNLMNLSELPRPHIFGQQVLDEFQIHLKKNPSYLKSIHSSLRTKSGFYFGGTFHLINRSYDAYEKDIAIVQVYFDTPTAVKFLTEPRLSWIDYISNVGGLLGLCVGLNIVTIIEIAWLIMRVGNSFLHRNR